MTVYIRPTYNYEEEDCYGLFNDCTLLMMSKCIDYLIEYAEDLGYDSGEVMICG